MNESWLESEKSEGEGEYSCDRAVRERRVRRRVVDVRSHEHHASLQREARDVLQIQVPVGTAQFCIHLQQIRNMHSTAMTRSWLNIDISITLSLSLSHLLSSIDHQKSANISSCNLDLNFFHISSNINCFKVYSPPQKFVWTPLENK